MNVVFVLIVLAAFLFGAVTGNMGEVSAGAFDGASKSVTLAISLIGYMALFLGLMRVAEEGGLLKTLGRAIRPIMVLLFPGVPADHPAMGAMIMNIAANMIGLTNAATPLGIKAMQELNKLNKTPGVATNAMVLFLAINTSGLALLPSGVVSVRAAYGSADPWGIMASTLAATACATIVGITAAKLFQRFFPVPAPTEPVADEASEPTPDDAPESEPENEPENETVTALLKTERETQTTWGVWVLRAFLLLSIGVLAGPPLMAAAVGEDDRPALEQGVDLSLFVWEKVTFEQPMTVVTTPPGSELTPGPFEGPFEPDAEGSWVLEEVCDAPPCTEHVATAVHATAFDLRHTSEQIGTWVIPVLILSLLLFGVASGVKVYEAFIRGAKEGFNTGVMIIPYLVAVLVAVGMFRGSGGMDWMASGIGLLTEPLGVPAEVIPMALVRPLSGSGAYGIMIELLSVHGPDSYIGYLASTLNGSTDTTFYVLAVYFGAVGVTKTRHAVLAGLSADFAGFLAAAIVCALMFGHLLG